MSTRLVYFIKPVEALGPIKIGTSDRVENRLRDLQFSSPTMLEIVATVPGGYAMEKSLHERFASARRHGEWFDPTPELCDYIDAVRNGLTDLHAPRDKTKDYIVTPLKHPGIYASGIHLSRRQIGLMIVVRSFYDFHAKAPTYADLCEATKLNRLQIHEALEGMVRHKIVSLSPSPPASDIRQPFPVRSFARVAA